MLELNPDKADTVRAPWAPEPGRCEHRPAHWALEAVASPQPNPLRRHPPGSNQAPGHVQTGRGQATGATGIPESPVPPVPATSAHAVLRDAFPDATLSCLPCGHGVPNAQHPESKNNSTAHSRCQRVSSQPKPVPLQPSPAPQDGARCPGCWFYSANAILMNS